MSERIETIKTWLTEQFGSIKSIAIASSDASFRGYFRVVFSACNHPDLSVNKPYIVMDAPPEFEDINPFIRIGGFLESHGLNVPHIYAINSKQGFLLLEDFGKENYLDNINTENADSLYQQAMSTLLKLQLIDKEQLINKKQGIDLPDYNDELLNREMDLFEQWYVNKHLGIRLNTPQQQILKQTLAYLTEQILQQPIVIVHRDYHSRNLMLVDNNNPGIIDFQDAVIGPCTYDLVSLLRDSYICWPDKQVETWVDYFYQQLVQNNVIQNCSFATFMQWFDFMGMQRQIKVVGIFSRLFHRDSKKNYLNDIPQTWSYLKASSKKYPQFKEFYNLLLELQE
jgi:N-acetylmuramate 1-kinase